MILLLGKNELVEECAGTVLGVRKSSIGHYPDSTTHYTEYEKVLMQIKEDDCLVITSQNIEFINFLLDSDLEFKVYTVYENFAVRKLTKEDAIEVHREMGLELR